MNARCRYELEVSAYVLAAHADEEAREFEVHLAGCARCRQDVARLRMAADALGASAPPVAPPPELKERVMAVVRAEADPRAAERGRWRWLRRRPPRPRSGRRLAWAAAHRRRRPLRLGSARLALAAALLVLGGAAGYALRPAGEETRVLRADVDRAAAAGASLVVRGDDATLRVRGLRAPSRGRVYQVWVTRPGETAPRPTNALFVPRADRTAAVAVPADAGELDRVLVTPEPPGGSPAPTARPIVVAHVQ